MSQRSGRQRGKGRAYARLEAAMHGNETKTTAREWPEILDLHFGEDGLRLWGTVRGKERCIAELPLRAFMHAGWSKLEAIADRAEIARRICVAVNSHQQLLDACRFALADSAENRNDIGERVPSLSQSAEYAIEQAIQAAEVSGAELNAFVSVPAAKKPRKDLEKIHPPDRRSPELKRADELSEFVMDWHRRMARMFPESVGLMAKDEAP